MACTDCKNKKEFKKEDLDIAGETPRWVIWLTIFMLIFSIYGIVSFIFDLMGDMI